MAILGFASGILIALISIGLGLWSGQYAYSRYHSDNTVLEPSHYRSFGFWFVGSSGVTLAGSFVLLIDPITSIAPIAGGTCLMLTTFSRHFHNHKLRLEQGTTASTPACV